MKDRITGGRRYVRIGVVLAALVALGALTAPPLQAAPAVAPLPSSDSWSARPPLQQPRGGLGVATVDGLIVAIAGFDHDAPDFFDFVEARRNTGPGTWRYLAPLPTARGNIGTAEVRGLVYAVGGYVLTGLSDAVETFNPRSGRWAPSLSLPQPRGAPGAAALDGLLYVAGGETVDSFASDSMDVYDPRRNTWRSVAPMPTARANFRLVRSGRYLYAIGGLGQQSESLTAVERYDPNSNSWRTMSPMVESRALPCAIETTVAQRRVIVVVGGAEFSPDGTFVGTRRTTEVFDPGTGRWTILDILLPNGRVSHDCATEADGTVLAIGGFVLDENNHPVPLSNVDALSLQPRHLR